MHLSVWGNNLSNEIADLIASRFIARRDVKAVQHSDGSWSPHTSDGTRDGERLPWRRSDINAHLEKTQTFGHYLLNSDSTCKLFAFDIDLEPNKPKGSPRPYQGHWVDEDGSVHEFDARADWQVRGHPSRNWSKYQLKMISSKLAARITADLEIPCAVAYSGGKGVHVYGFTGLVPAPDALEGALMVLESLGGWSPSRGNNFFRSDDQDPESGYPNLTIEVFPKQDSLSDGGLGNLMRLPLGRNLKSKDPTFFVDLTSPMAQMVPVDPVWAMTTTSPWKTPQ